MKPRITIFILVAFLSSCAPKILVKNCKPVEGMNWQVCEYISVIR